ncbi:neuronal acetylcholine receptor subunit alpha-6 [Elysia marginata]|uniref:Neuronal acetylcholine receptor subunit alpha-6 n=1 Tax=Elysia marginata TaxID=1093978 RepID=A0AAV4JMH5_9GAST|nr:neuronal acetylcholine receptor subunit alpha-6 [Elysia marginata]
MTGTLSLALPADAGEKMGMCLTVLLSYTVYLTIVSDELPNTSVQISVLSVYLTLLIAITTSSVVMTVVILRLHHKSETEQVGPGTQKLVRTLKRLTCREKTGKHRSNSVTPFFLQKEATEM